MLYRSILLMAVICIVFSLTALPTVSSQGMAHIQGYNTASSLPSQNIITSAPQMVIPLPRGCGSLTPAGAAEPICCINGAVYLDGQPVTGAKVHIEVKNRPANQITLYTQPVDAITPVSSYQLSLSSPPISAAVGDELIITAEYGLFTSSVTYKTRPGSQQVNIVLPWNNAHEHIIKNIIPYAAPDGALYLPQGVATDNLGNVFVLDTWNHRVQVFDSNGQYLWQFGSRGTLPGQFNRPLAITLDSANNVYVADWLNYRIQKLTSHGKPLVIWGNEGDAPGQFGLIKGIAVDSSGNVYVSDNGRIQKFSSTGQILAVWTGSQDTVSIPFEGPIGLDIDTNDNLYVADGRILKLSPSGQLLQIWQNIRLNNNELSYPQGVAVDRANNIYVLDSNEPDHHIYKLNSPNQAPVVLGMIGYVVGDGWWQEGIAVDQIGNVLVTNTANHSILKISPDGQQGTIGQQATLLYPMGISLDKNHNLYVVGGEDGRIKKFSRIGELEAVFTPPTAVNDLVVDSVGNMYLEDFYNNRVLKLSPTGQLLATWSDLIDIMIIDRFDILYIRTSGGIKKIDTNGNFISYFQPEGCIEFWKMLVDPVGNIYIKDCIPNSIRKVDAIGNFISEFTLPPDASSSDNDIAADSDGIFYLSEYDSPPVYKVSSTGAFLGEISPGRGVGPGRFREPSDLEVDNDNTLYVADMWNHNVQSFRAASFTRPIATLSSVSSRTLAFNATLEAYGMGQDSDLTQTIQAYRWQLDNTTDIGITSALSVPASQLTPGPHTISFMVQDDEGEWSDPVNFQLQVASPPQAEWTMMLYLDGDYDDNNMLFDSFTTRLNALRRSLPNGYVRIAVLVDGPEDGDTRRMLISPGTPALVVESNVGEQDLDDPNVLSAFLSWAKANAPAKNYYLAIANHGQALQGIAWDKTSDLRNDGQLNHNAYLTVKELGEALKSPNVPPIAVLHLDACSMNLLELSYELRERVGILIASQYLGWSYFAYNDYQALMHHDKTPYDVAIGITNHYAELATADDNPFSIAALDLRRAEPALKAVDTLAAELESIIVNPGQTDNRPMLDTIRQASQTLESNGDFMNTAQDEYIDLLDWATRIRNGVSYPAARARASDLITELTGPSPFILSSKTQSGSLHNYANGANVDLSHAQGLSIFYPLAWETQVHKDYVSNKLFSFTQSSRWPDFLLAELGTPEGVTRQSNGPLTTLIDKKFVFLPSVVR